MADAQAGLVARRAALALMNAVLGEGRMLSEIPEPELPPSERARARRLVEETLRQLEPADRLLDPHLRRGPPMAVQNALRLALVEMAGGAAAHGVVNAYVSLMRQGKRTESFSGLVNAVLRKVDASALAAQPVQKLPRWMRQPMVHAWGRDVVAQIEAIHAATPPLDLTLRAEAGTTAAAQPDLAPQGEQLPTGSLRLVTPGQVSGLPGFAEGSWWVQDAAAAIPARLLQAQAGERVLDLCAAPGGKTMQLACTGAAVTALDISEPRCRRIRENLARTGLVAELVVGDALHWQPDAPFDAILLDAPCSATGTLRRHPDLPFIKDGSEIAALAELQAALIDRALGWLKPGGRLVFATCSLLLEEGEAQLTAALARHPDLQVERVDLAGVEADWWTEAGGLRLRPDHWPERGGMDGFFCMRLRKA